MSLHTFFVAPTGFGVGLTSTSLGLIRALERTGLKVHFLKPIAQPHPGDDGPERSSELISRTLGLTPPPSMTLSQVEHQLAMGELDEVLEEIVSRYQQAAQDADVVVVEGMVPTRQSNYASQINQQLAKSLDADVILVTAPDGDDFATLADRIEINAQTFGGPKHPKVLGVIINKVKALATETSADIPDRPTLKSTLKDFAQSLREASSRLDTDDFRLIGCVPWQEELNAPRTSDIAELLRATTFHAGDMQQRRVMEMALCSRTVPNIIHLLRPGALIVTPGDRDDIIIASSLA